MGNKGNTVYFGEKDHKTFIINAEAIAGRGRGGR
jgi:hypothetical protein